MRLVLTALILFSVWHASVILGSATILRLNSNPGEQAAVPISLARTIDNGHPQVLEWLSRFGGSETERLHAARELTRAEPFLGSGWADLFERKLEGRELDDELETALSQAIEFSPYDPLIQEQLIRIALRSWQVLTPSIRRAIVELAADSLESKATYRMDSRRALVRDSGLLPLVCQVSAQSLCDNG
jgi:hypothetical protein